MNDMDAQNASEPRRLVIENLVVPRCHAELGPFEPRGQDGAARGRGHFRGHAFSLDVLPSNRGLVLSFADGAPPEVEVRSLLDALFAGFLDANSIEVHVGDAVTPHRRHTFYQIPDLWHFRGDRYPPPLAFRTTGAVRHPERPDPKARVLYRRHAAAIGRTYSLTRFDLDEHFDLFCTWMNDPEVAHFWELAFERPRLAEYLLERIEDPHTTPVIGWFDDVPFAYFELYWAKEDRLGPHYDANDYDRGFHMAVGDPRFRYRGFGRHWFLGMAHFLFLDDPRTMQLVGEPRVDQARVTGWARSTPWQIVKEFDFPHKRAALMTLDRDRYFGSFAL
jgi:N2-citryl-N6-acetyl-N6-hydroxylysine synthase